MNRTSGIYTIYSSVNGRTYIGSAVNIASRWRQHRYDLRKNNHHSQHLQRAWNKYGEDAFEFSVIEECPPEQLIEREQWHMDQCSDRYNCAPVAGSPLGMTRSPEARAKMSAAHMGCKNSDEARAKMSASLMGHAVSDETRKKISDTLRGHSVSAETREKIRQSKVGNKYRAGRKASPETRERIRAAAIIREERRRMKSVDNV